MSKPAGILLIGLLLISCEPIIDLSTPKNGTTAEGIFTPTVSSTIRPKNAVLVPADPTLQITLLSDDASKGWVLKKRIKENVDVTHLCMQDDGIILHKSKRIDFEVGAIKCGVDDRAVSGVWQLTDRPSLLLSSGETPPYEVQLLELSKHKLMLSYTDEEGDLFVEMYETPVIEPEPEATPIVLAPSPSPVAAPTALPSATPTPSTTPTPSATPDFFENTTNTGNFSGF